MCCDACKFDALLVLVVWFSSCESLAAASEAFCFSLSSVSLSRKSTQRSAKDCKYLELRVLRKQKVALSYNLTKLRMSLVSDFLCGCHILKQQRYEYIIMGRTRYGQKDPTWLSWDACVDLRAEFPPTIPPTRRPGRPKTPRTTTLPTLLCAEPILCLSSSEKPSMRTIRSNTWMYPIFGY